jgi:alanyl-tRNA synthetase
MTRSEAESKFGFTIYQGGVVPGKDLRIVEIPGIDVEACGGTHANQTGDIGYIRILGSERIQDGVVRITLTAGKRAVEQSQHEYQLLKESADAFSVNPEELPMTSERFFKEWKEQAKTIGKLSKQLAEAKVPELIQSAKKIKTAKSEDVRVIVTTLDAPQADLINLAEQFSLLTEKTGDLIAVILGSYDNRAMVVTSRSKGSSYPLGKIVKGIGRLLGGGGGGKGDVLTGGGTRVEELPRALKEARAIVKREL